jgi:Stage II sporulation protein E (SpoIIE).
MLLLSILMVGSAYAQMANTDSLENILKFHHPDDTIKVNLLNDIAYEFFIKDPDKTMQYATQAEELSDKLHFQRGKVESMRLIGVGYMKSDQKKALTYFQSALKIAEAIDYKIGIVKCLNSMVIIYSFSQDDAKAFECAQKAFKIAEAMNNKLEMARCMSSIARCDGHLGHYAKAIEEYKQALLQSSEMNDKPLMAANTHNLGVIYTNQGNYPIALEYFLNAYKIYQELGDKQGCFLGIYGIGNIKLSQSDYPQALEYAKKSLKIAEELKDKVRITAALRLIGDICRKMKNPQALEYYQKALKISKEINNASATISTLISLGEYYRQNSNYEKAMECFQDVRKNSEQFGHKNILCIALYSISNIYLERKEYTAALVYSLRSLNIAIELKLKDNQRDIRNQLSKIYVATNDYKKAYTNYKLFKELNDSLYGESSVKKIAELEYSYKYEKEKQAIELDHQKKDIIQASEERQQRIIMISLIVAFMLVSLLAIYIFRSYRIKRQSNIHLTKQKRDIEAKNDYLVQLNEEISAQREEISAQRDEIEMHRDLVVRQRDHIEAQKEKITDSIDYAQHIQQALMPSSEYATANLGEHFILFKPKAIVSGDFYWSSMVKEYLIVTVADCTGHGVPGALMSMLGMSFLNEIVAKKEVVKASEILDQLRKSVVDALQQKWQTGEQKDGMDMVLVVINTKTAQLQYAGAQNPLYLVTAGGDLKIIKPDNQTVAINIEMRPFTNHEIGLNKGDCIYLTTDGYHDQFGGPNNKKFKGKQLNELLVSIAKKPMDEQREILDRTFEGWRGNGEQIDDVTIVGCRI